MLHSWRIKTGELSDELGLSVGLVQSILTKDLGMKCISLKFVPKLLTVEQKEIRLAVARDLLQCAGQDANYLKTLITGDESWVYGYDPETKASEANKARKFRSKGENDVDSFLQSPRHCSPKVCIRWSNC
jgi:hypothetical protein